MKKGQATGIIILLLIIIAVIVIYLAVKPSLTGKTIAEDTSKTGLAIKQPEEIVCNSPYIRVGRSCCLDMNSNKICDNEEDSSITGSGSINLPFYLYAFDINSGGIKLEIMNTIDRTFWIKEVAVSNCGTTGYSDTSFRVFDGKDSRRVFDIPCSLSSGTRFKGDITIKYRMPDSLMEGIMKGTIEGIVNN